MKKYLFITLVTLIGILAMSTTSVRNARMISKLTVFENLVTPLTTTYIELNGGDESINYRDGDTRNDGAVSVEQPRRRGNGGVLR